jgi:polyisoprenoid-binding protein YceI
VTEHASGSVAAIAPPPGTYTLDPGQTIIRANVKAMFGLLTVHGTFRLKSGQVVIAAEESGSSVRAIIDAASYASGNATRDRDVIAPGLLDAQGFPEITFTGQGARRDGTGWVVAGSVTAHGTPAPAEVRVGNVRPEGADGPAGADGYEGAVRFLATARLDRTIFGVTKKKGMVGRTVNLVIEAVGRPA